LARTAYLLAAAALTALLFAASFVPIAGRAAPGAWHWIAHFGAYAALAFLWRRALPRAPLLAIAAAVIAFGFAQEALEIAGHAHGFELADALIDAAGAAAGIAAAQVSFRRNH
jgi:VanZ family protein